MSLFTLFKTLLSRLLRLTTWTVHLILVLLNSFLFQQRFFNTSTSIQQRPIIYYTVNYNVLYYALCPIKEVEETRHRNFTALIV